MTVRAKKYLGQHFLNDDNIAKKIVSNLQANEKKMKEACSEEVYAAKKATELVLKGMPFREAYKKISKEDGF